MTSWLSPTAGSKSGKVTILEKRLFIQSVNSYRERVVAYDDLVHLHSKSRCNKAWY